MRNCQKNKNLNTQNIVDKINKLIIKELKLYVNRHIKTDQKSQPFSSLIMHSRAENNPWRKFKRLAP
jgi:hypothetical protein